MFFHFYLVFLLSLSLSLSLSLARIKQNRVNFMTRLHGWEFGLCQFTYQHGWENWGIHFPLYLLVCKCKRIFYFNYFFSNAICRVIMRKCSQSCITKGKKLCHKLKWNCFWSIWCLFNLHVAQRDCQLKDIFKTSESFFAFYIFLLNINLYN